MGIPVKSNRVRNILFVDPSASHLAYTVVEHNPNTNTMLIVGSGMLWTDPKWTRGQRFMYMSDAFQVLIEGPKGFPVTDVITEQYFFAPKKFNSGVAVVPTVNGILNMKATENYATFNEVPPPTWRMLLGIKPVKNKKGKRDYKQPTIELVNSFIEVPDNVMSNITFKDRKTPHDLYDSLAIMLATGVEWEVENFDLGAGAFYPLSFYQKFDKIRKYVEERQIK